MVPLLITWPPQITRSIPGPGTGTDMKTCWRLDDYNGHVLEPRGRPICGADRQFSSTIPIPNRYSKTPGTVYRARAATMC
jgi:hypothetical protein